MGFFSNWKNFKNISIGLVYVLFVLWLIFHTGQYVPEGQTDQWFRILIAYGVLNSIIFANADLRNKLFNTKFTDFLPRFIFFFLISVVVWYVLFSVGDVTGKSYFGILGSIPLWLAMIHAVVFATTESAIWQGLLDKKLGVPASALIAGVFHWGIWQGSPIFVILGAGSLFMLFSYINYRFKKDDNDLVPAIATHTAYNFIKLGLLVVVGGGFVLF